MATARRGRNPQDFTGAQYDKMMAEKEAEARETSRRMTMATSPMYREPDTITNVVTGEVEQVDIPSNDIVVDGDIVVDSERLRVMRVVVDLPHMTYGVGNTYSFEAGKMYRVPEALYNHLEEKGYVWH